MGISGLLPFLEKGKVSRPASIKEFAGCTVVADAYCWLHKGAFSCADKLARGEETDVYVQYCMKYVNMLLSHGIKPILVFDGRHLPAKAQTEKKRREKREENRKQAANLLRQGNTTEGLSYLRRCIDVTHKMALMVMKECRKFNVDCIVAPYEADAQLAFFNLEGIAELVITEDSDLLLFGCKKVMFKLDLAGNGVLVEQDRLHQSMGSRPENYSFTKFRYMCILSGCDYLESLPGIGLGKACKFITRTQDPDIHRALSRLPSQLNIRSLTVPAEYRDQFLRADAMFQHQLVFDPIKKCTRPLTPYDDVHPGSVLAAGPLPGCLPEFDDETNYQLALGNLDPFTLEKVDDFDPCSANQQNLNKRSSGWNQGSGDSHPSIWSEDYDKFERKKPSVTPSFMPTEKRIVTKDKVKNVDTSQFATSFNKKRNRDDDTVEHELISNKKQSLDAETVAAIYFQSDNSDSITNDSGECPTSPILSSQRTSRNPFAKKLQFRSPNSLEEESLASEVKEKQEETTKVGALSRFARAVQKTTCEGKPFIQSRYFASAGSLQPSPEGLLKDVCNLTQKTTLEKEKEILQMYSNGTPTLDDKEIPRLRKKSLFASQGSTSDQDSCRLQNSGEKKLADDSQPSLLPFTNRNPFRKSAFGIENDEPESVVCLTPSPKKLDHSISKDDPLIDDFKEDSKIRSYTSPQSIQKIDTPRTSGTSIEISPSIRRNQRNEVCRFSGLKKNLKPSPGQSKLSAFGFKPKSKLQN